MTLAKMEMSELLESLQDNAKRLGTSGSLLMYELALHVADLQATATDPGSTVVRLRSQLDAADERIVAMTGRGLEALSILGSASMEGLTEAAARVVRERDEALRVSEETSARLIQQGLELAATHEVLRNSSAALDRERRSLKDSREDHASALAEIGRLDDLLQHDAGLREQLSQQVDAAESGRRVALEQLKLWKEICDVIVNAAKLETQDLRADYWRDQFLRVAGAETDATDRDIKPAT